MITYGKQLFAVNMVLNLSKGWFPLSRNFCVDSRNFLRVNARKFYARKQNRGNVWKDTRKRETWTRFNFYVYAWPLFYLRA